MAEPKYFRPALRARTLSPVLSLLAEARPSEAKKKSDEVSILAGVEV